MFGCWVTWTIKLPFWMVLVSGRGLAVTGVAVPLPTLGEVALVQAPLFLEFCQDYFFKS